MDDDTFDTVCALVADACGLVERARRLDVRDEGLAAEAALVRAELDAARVAGADPGLADDAAGAAAQLDAVLARLDRLPTAVPALSGTA
jgi:hypothetical protein